MKILRQMFVVADDHPPNIISGIGQDKCTACETIAKNFEREGSDESKF